MKRLIMLIFIILAVPVAGQSGKIVYHNADEFPVYGKISDETNTRYERLPGYLENVTRKPVWNLGLNSAGLYIRFRSDSPILKFKWALLQNTRKTHMPDTTIKGVDLYMQTDNGWRYVACPKLVPDSLRQEVTVRMDPVEREYMLYLSLYDNVVSLEIGVEEGSFIGQPASDSPRHEKPVIMYGTSILQGGCASRPGMAHSNILARKLNRDVINLGFAGNALLDYEIAELMASYEDPGIFVLDYTPNASGKRIDENSEKFFRILRDAHPDVPIVFVELPPYPRAEFYTKGRNAMQEKNDAQQRIYEKLRKAGEKNIFYIKSEGMLGDDGDATVDGTHFSDLGMLRYAEHVLPTLKKALARNR